MAPFDFEQWQGKQGKAVVRPNIELLCTLGPSSMSGDVIQQLADLGTTLFRVNLSHTELEDLVEVIKFIKSATSVPICLDTEGGSWGTKPPFTRKDYGAIGVGVDMGINHFALSFADCGEDVAELHLLGGHDAFVISKIESANGLANLEDIADKSDALLIDRGDLSHEIPIERIPRAQKVIIQKAREMAVPVYVATNLLESMVTSLTPTLAEVNDVYNTLADGAAGLVLAGETAIGKYPVECAEMIMRIARDMRDDPR